MKYNDFKKQIKSSMFSSQDIRLLSLKVFAYQLTLWQKQGYIIKLKNGLYAFEDSLNGIAPEDAAQKLYSPSYISLEKALSYYGFIPEMVYAITSVTPKTTRRINNKIGSYIYRHIKPELFFGYSQTAANKTQAPIAEPEKAILDFIYFNSANIKNMSDIEGFRLNKDAVKETINPKKMKAYAGRFGSKKIDMLVKDYFKVK